MTEKTDWNSASGKCADQDPEAHLVVISNNKKTTTIKNFIEGEDITSYRRYL